MILRNLVLENFGVFKGMHEFDLRPRGHSKPIILFGGKNGSGKTTILEAVKLCLYGNNFKKRPISKKTYESYLRKKIHSTKFVKNIDNAQVSLEFEISYLGVTTIYNVTRKWSLNEDKVCEQFILNKNGKQMDLIEESYWEAFIHDMIPKGIFELFFFDGEKIKSLADDDSSHELRTSMKNLLGLELVDRLTADLNIYKSKKIKELSTKDLTKNIEKYEREISSLESVIDNLRQKKAQKAVQIDRQRIEISRIEDKLSAQGGLFAKHRDELKERKKEVDEKIFLSDDKIRSLAIDLLPFVLLPRSNESLRTQIQMESEYRDLKNMKKVTEDTLREVFKTIKNSDVLSKQDKEGIISQINNRINGIVLVKDKQEGPLIHQFSRPQEQKILYALDRLEHETPSEFISLIQDLEQLIRERQDLERHLGFVPSDDVMGGLLNQLNEVNREFGSMEAELKTIEEQLRSEQFKLDQIKREKIKYEEKISQNGNLTSRLDLVDKVQLVLGEYSKRLEKDKLRLVEQQFLECFSTILRKNRHIEHVKIDDESFMINLYESEDTLKAREDLSSAEKQIYALALLWALIKVSGKPLPLMIDTPLARLDSDHRGTVIKNFFPKASHQVITFSTDTEIDEKYFKIIKPHTSHSYHLSFNDEEKFTEVREGYFWEVA